MEFASQKKHCAHYLAALGSLLNRTPFYGGPESVAPPALVERANEAFSRRFDWNDPGFAEVQVLFVRAARAIDNRRLDLSRSLRNQIANKLEKCGIAPAKTGRLKNVVPVERAERLSLYGEVVPPGLIFSEYGTLCARPREGFRLDTRKIPVQRPMGIPPEEKRPRKFTPPRNLYGGMAAA